MSRGLAANVTTDFYTIYVFRILWVKGAEGAREAHAGERSSLPAALQVTRSCRSRWKKLPPLPLMLLQHDKNPNLERGMELSARDRLARALQQLPLPL
jgi:hypothetical protein